MEDQFTRSRMMFGSGGMQQLQRARVAVFGIGGVGGYALEALVRGGIGAVDIVDNDTVNVTNINRQIIAAHNTVGMLKTRAASERIAQLNPQCRVVCRNTFFLSESADEFDFTEYDYVVDAIDTVAGKLALAVECSRAGTPLISSMGTGNKLNAAMLEVSDIYKTSVCPLARVMRRELRARGIESLKVVYSKEQPFKPEQPAETGGRTVPASNSFVPPAAGLIIAGEVIKDLLDI